MVNNREHYTLLAKLFNYPTGRFIQDVRESIAFLKSDYPEAANELQIFYEYMDHCTLDEQQELFTKTFDVQPICYLDLGYVMFGEDYKRGAFLLCMQTEQIKIGNNCGTDLPDNLCNVLTLMTISNDKDFIEDLTWRITIPSVKKMISEFAMARVDLKMKVLRKMHRAIIQEELNHGNVYKNCFTALLQVLVKDFGEKEFTTAEDTVLTSTHHQSFFNKQKAIATINIQNSEAQEYASLQNLD
ncbi:MAG: hypothetical protein IPP77_06710 [Bacteroidetes bacterium]|nr:hypothetical protein [Bacteroidota bacterium]